MAAALFRGGSGLCLRCIHRELCRVAWRPQAAAQFSSKASDGKPPRRTHIKKAKPQPAVDVAKLLEQLFSQERPGTAPPAAGKAQLASSIATKPMVTKVSTSAVPHLSKKEAAVPVFPAASGISKTAASTFSTSPLSPRPKSASPENPEPSFSPEAPQQSPLGFIQDFAADVSTASVPATSSSPPTGTEPALSGSGSGAATAECQTSAVTRETKIETAAGAAESAADPLLPSSDHMVEKDVEKSPVPAATVEPLMEPTAESSVEPSVLSVEALETGASVAEAPVEPMIDVTVDTTAQEVLMKTKDSAEVDNSYTSTVEPSVETPIEPLAHTSITPPETIESKAAVVSGKVEPKIEAEADQERAVNDSYGAKQELLIETTMKSPVDALEARPVVDATVEAPAREAEAKSIDTSHAVAEEPLLELEVEPSVEASPAAVVEGTVEPKSSVESLKTDELLQTKSILDVVETSLASDQSTGVNGDSTRIEEKATEEEALTLESMTLVKVEAEVGSLETEVLQEASDLLESEADASAKKTESEEVVFEDTTEAEVLGLDGISEAKDAIEAETSVVLEAMFGSEQGARQPADTLASQDETIGQEVEEGSAEQKGGVLEAMSLESVTLAEVEASLGTLANESLGETAAYLENEAEILAGERAMEAGEGEASEEMMEALDAEPQSLPEADSLTEDLQTDALIEELLFTVPGNVGGATEALISQEAEKTNISDAAVETDEYQASPAPEEAPLGEKTAEEGAPADEGAGTHTDMDPVQRLFLEKIREYNNMRRLNGRPVEAEADYERRLSEETAKLQRLYGGGDLSSFPQFTFTDPKWDQDSK